MVKYAEDILVPEGLRANVERLSQVYGKDLLCTSGLRTPERQAEAMYENYKAGRGVQYQKVALEREIQEVWDKYYHMPNTPKSVTVKMMTNCIGEQIERGEFLSYHLIGQAADFSLGQLDVDAMQKAVANIGGFGYLEKHCYHVTFQSA